MLYILSFVLAAGSKNTRITDAIGKFIVHDNLPFSVVEGKGFLNILKELAPLYKVPTRNTIKYRIDKKYDRYADNEFYGSHYTFCLGP